MVAWLRQTGAALRALLVLTVILGVIYPLVVTGIGQVAFRSQANGSPVRHDGREVGSRLIGQDLSGPQWFHPRPSAAGEKGYDALSSGASNLGPSNPELAKLIAQRRATVAKEEGVAPSAVPPDAVTASGSGLDPDISPQYALIQINRVARTRGLDPSKVRALVERHTAGRQLGFLGAPHVNVVELNLALARLAHG